MLLEVLDVRAAVVQSLGDPPPQVDDVLGAPLRDRRTVGDLSRGRLLLLLLLAGRLLGTLRLERAVEPA